MMSRFPDLKDIYITHSRQIYTWFVYITFNIAFLSRLADHEDMYITHTTYLFMYPTVQFHLPVNLHH